MHGQEQAEGAKKNPTGSLNLHTNTKSHYKVDGNDGELVQTSLEDVELTAVGARQLCREAMQTASKDADVAKKIHTVVEMIVEEQMVRCSDI